MNRNIRPTRTTQLALFAIACVIAGGPAVAQTTVNEVTVEAPRTVSTQVDQSNPPGGAKVEVTTIKLRVSYADPDLTKSADAAAVQTRIKAAATDACAQLDKLYPLQPDSNCVDKAIVTATAQAEGAIAAAGR